MVQAPSGDTRKRVLIIGAGAAGTACAWSLSRSPEKFDVHLWEALSQPGGVASSLKVDTGAGPLIINDQVQGGALSYRHNLALLKTFGFKPTPVMMRIAFGVGGAQWTNHSPSRLTSDLQPEIKRFGDVLKTISRLEPIFIFVPIDKVLTWWGFSQAFREEMVLPLVALFFGTGNQTSNVAAAVIARVFLDPDLRLFDYSPERLLDSVPEMFAFPVLQDIFKTIAASSPYTLHCNRPLKSVKRDKTGITATDAHGVSEHFTDIVYACDAETVLQTLEKPTWLEKKLLGNVTYYTDYCVTHEDTDYMSKMYDIKPAQRDNYFVRTYPEAPKKIEMSFNLSTYQPHLAEAGLDVYQTYYLNAKDKAMWTDGQVAEDKVLAKRWMRQFAHTWQHFAFWVPFVRFIQGTQHTYFAGSYTMVNTQEIAVMSGIAAAERLGAEYPFPDDPLAVKQYEMYLGIAHGKKRGKPTGKAYPAPSQATMDKVAAALATATPPKSHVLPIPTPSSLSPPSSNSGSPQPSMRDIVAPVSV
ncbi:MAG: hypothetical protein WDW38_009596 [Sanguina aurantia]